MNLLSTNGILDLYKKYYDELLEIEDEIKLFLDENCKKGLNPQFSDIEAEITYMFIRELKPKNIVEFSPCYGYSSIWILNALTKNNNGILFSFDLISESNKYIPDSLKERRIFFEGDVKSNIDKFPKSIDYLFIDSDHSEEFCQWYIKSVFPMVKNNTYVSVHDVIKRKHPNKLAYGEGREIIKWLNEHEIPYYSAGLKRDVGDLDIYDPNAREIIDNYKKVNKFNKVNIYGKYQRNSAIFFVMEK